MLNDSSQLSPIARKVLTLYGPRDFPRDPGETATITRALAHLNGYVHELMRDNPGLVVESVSHTQFIHPGQAQMSVPARLWFFATIVYSGEITDVQRLAYYDTREQQLPFDGDAPAYGTVIYVEL